MSGLPAERGVERSKIEDYLLHPINSRGTSAFFEAFGFSQARWQELHSALLEQAASCRLKDEVEPLYGTHHGQCRAPRGRAGGCLTPSTYRARGRRADR